MQMILPAAAGAEAPVFDEEILFIIYCLIIWSKSLCDISFARQSAGRRRVRNERKAKGRGV